MNDFNGTNCPTCAALGVADGHLFWQSGFNTIANAKIYECTKSEHYFDVETLALIEQLQNPVIEKPVRVGDKCERLHGSEGATNFWHADDRVCWRQPTGTYLIQKLGKSGSEQKLLEEDRLPGENITDYKSRKSGEESKPVREFDGVPCPLGDGGVFLHWDERRSLYVCDSATPHMYAEHTLREKITKCTCGKNKFCYQHGTFNERPIPKHEKRGRGNSSVEDELDAEYGVPLGKDEKARTTDEQPPKDREYKFHVCSPANWTPEDTAEAIRKIISHYESQGRRRPFSI
jgi:hypothetical protein